jgi:hypothetical protein
MAAGGDAGRNPDRSRGIARLEGSTFRSRRTMVNPRETAMARTLYTPSTLTAAIPPDPLVRYIEQALLAIANRARG